MADGPKIPTSRAVRTARIGRVAAAGAAKRWGTQAANAFRSDEAAELALERRHIEAAEQLVTVLGSMKGAAMKVGQVLSFLDVGLVPEDYREEFQRKLSVLRDAAPDVPFDGMRKVIEADLGGRISDHYADFDPEAIAAASIGQVYRARLHDGREVAVKVQYPGVADAVRADMQNLGLILRVVKRVAPGLDAQAVGREIRERITEELDYELEAANHRSLARAYRGHPFIVIPEVMTELSAERVITTGYVEGRGFEEMKGLGQDERDRIGEILFRFYLGSPHRHRMFSGDPHPGNCLLLDDGRMAFLDFGLFKRLPAEIAEAEAAAMRAGAEGDAERLKELFARHGFLADPDRFDAERLLEQFLDATGWFLIDDEIALSPQVAARVALEMGDPRSRHFEAMRHQTLPAEHVFGRRVEMLTLAVLGQLNARANWFRVASEWLYGAEPETDLGRTEAEHARR